MARQYISPHASVAFTEVPAVCEVHSDSVAIDDVFDPTRPLFLGETIIRSLESCESKAAFSSTPRPLERIIRKQFNLHSLQNDAADRVRNVSAPLDETPVGRPSELSSESSLVASRFGLVLKDAAEKTAAEKQADKIGKLEEVCEDLRIQLNDETKRAEELKTDLETCDKHRSLNFNSALRLYGNTGILALVERRNLLDQVDQLRFEVRERDALISSRNELIQDLHSDLIRYASHEQWNLLRQAFYNLQQQYGQMPQDFRYLERRCEDLEDKHIEMTNDWRKLEGDYTELKAQCDQIKDERDQLEDDVRVAEQKSADAAGRLWAVEVERDQIREKKAKTEKKSKAREELLVGLATRIFNQNMSMAGVLKEKGVDAMNKEQTELCQLACKYLGFDAIEVNNAFDKSRANGDKKTGTEHSPGGVLGSFAREAPSSNFTFDFNDHEAMTPDAAGDGRSRTATTNGGHMPESPNTFDAKGRREVAAAKKEVLGPLGLGFENGTPTLRTKPIFEIPKPSKTSKFTAFFPKTTEAPSKNWGNIGTPGAEGTGGGHDLDNVEDSAGSNGKRSDTLKETPFGFHIPEQSSNPFSTPATAALSFESRFATFNAIPKTPLPERFPIFQGLGSHNNVSDEESHALPSLSSKMFAAPQAQDFKFATNNGGISFTASQTPSTCPLATASQNDIATASSLSSSSIPDTTPSASAQPNSQPSEETPSPSNIINQRLPAQSMSDPNTPKKKNREPKKSKDEPQQEQEPKNDGPNRKQRRATDRDRKVAEKKAEAAAAAEKVRKARKGKGKGKEKGVVKVNAGDEGSGERMMGHGG